MNVWEHLNAFEQCQDSLTESLLPLLFLVIIVPMVRNVVLGESGILQLPRVGSTETTQY